MFFKNTVVWYIILITVNYKYFTYKNDFALGKATTPTLQVYTDWKLNHIVGQYNAIRIYFYVLFY